MSHDHDHSGDRLGEDAPVESITVNEVTMREFDLPAAYLVYATGRRANDDQHWFALRTGSQEVEFDDADGAKVINWALKRLGELAPEADQKGLVRVTAPEEDFFLRTPTTIEHTTDGTALIIEPNFHHMRRDDPGWGEAVRLAGDGLHLDFSTIEAHGARYGFRDLGLSNSTVRGNLFLHSSIGSEDGGGWLCDAENQTHPTPADAGYTFIHFAWLYSRHGPFGIKMSSAPGARFENYRWKLPIFFGGETPLILGDRNDAQSVHNNIFMGDIDAASSGSPYLAEINDSHNGIYLKDYTPGSGEYDILIRPSATDSFVLPLTAQGHPWALKVQREAVAATDVSKFDPFKAQTVRFDLVPDSLAGYATERQKNGQINLYSGFIEQTTGDVENGWANLHRRVGANYARLTFENHGALQTNVQVMDNTNQQAWLLWGDREGPGVGWHIEDDALHGWVHDGEEETTVPLRTGFDPGVAWNLTAFYNPPESIQYFVEDLNTEDASTPSESRDWKPRTEDAQLDAEVTVETADPIEFEGSFSVSPTEEDEHFTAYQLMAIDLTNTAPEEKGIRWSMWRNHQYPIAQ